MDITKIATYGIRGASPKKLERVKGDEKFSLGESSTIAETFAPMEIKLSPIDALFLNLDSRRRGQKQAIEKGDKILKQLDELRLDIITGSIPKDTLENITSLLKDQIESTIDERLRNILLEIETRARVELAKLER
jgi:hypothetical protein